MSTMNLGQKQELFAECLGKLIAHIYAAGYKIRMGDVWAKPRNPLEHKANSQHYAKCAADINLFNGDVFLTTEDYHKPFGEFWESLHPDCRWGGRFQDSNHYEIRP